MSGDFDRAAAYALDDRVALRPESFGALAYHFGTRRLSFLKHPDLVRVVEGLGCHESAASALRAAGVATEREPGFLRALAQLEDTGMIVRRGVPAP